MSILTYTARQVASVLVAQVNYKKDTEGVVVIKQNKLGGISAKIIR